MVKMMTNRMLGLGLLGIAVSGIVHADPLAGEWQPLGFAQLTAERFEDDDGIDFGGDRIRAGVRYDSTSLFGGLVLDFNVPNGGDRTPGTLNNVIKDVYVGWKFTPQWSGKFGQFKTPIGMDFNTPGNALDITKRAMEKPLVLERDLGVMMSGRKLAGQFGVDVGIFNPAGRSGAANHTDDQEGESNAYAGRLLWDYQQLHLEVAYGISEEAGGEGTEDYHVYDIGLRYKTGPLTLKAEWIAGEDVLGVEDRQERVVYGHAGFRFLSNLEAVIRHYDGRAETAGGDETSLGNTWLGLNWWPTAPEHADLRLQFNYVIASRDEEDYTGLGGFADNAALLQLQLSYK